MPRTFSNAPLIDTQKRMIDAQRNMLDVNAKIVENLKEQIALRDRHIEFLKTQLDVKEEAMVVWAINTECADAFYGSSIDYLFFKKEHAVEAMEQLAKINRGITYFVNDWPISRTAQPVFNYESQEIINPTE